MDSTACKAWGCKYNTKGFCGFDVKFSHDIVEEQCLPSDNWYIVGSFVLDRIFDKNTANDIDLVMPEGEMPAKLPDEIVQAALPIEMIWRSPQDRRGFDFHNISLPRITPDGLANWETAEALKNSKMISALAGIRKIPALTIFIAVKSITKYGLCLDEKTFTIWARSIVSPLGWKEYYRFAVPWIREINWDYLRAQYLVQRVERAYEKATEHERKMYLDRLREVLTKLELGNDIGYQLLLEYVTAGMEGNIEKSEELVQIIRNRCMKIR